MARAWGGVGYKIGEPVTRSAAFRARIGSVVARAGSLVPEWRVEIGSADRQMDIAPTRRFRFVVGLAAAAAVAAIGVLGLGALAHHRQLAAREATVQGIAAASAELRAAVVRFRTSLDRARQDLAPLRVRDAALDTTAGRTRDQLVALRQQLQHLQGARAPAEAARLRAQAENQAAEIARARALTEQQLRQAAAQQAVLADRLAQAQAALADSLRQSNASKLALQQTREKLRRVEIARARAGGGAEHARRLAAIGRKGVAASGRLGKLTHLLASTGVDVERFLARFGVQQRGIGGPFIPARDAPRPLSPAQQAAFRMMLHALPLTAPLHRGYRIGSPFGDRHDPFNGHAEFHPGIDLDAPYMTPVYATAPGTVTYAGWMAGYGRMVEINHGSGIVTRYAHLHRYTVVVGQKVRPGTRVGLLGSTGRSTGPHLHYEIRVNDEPVNPQRFLNLGREVVRRPIIPISAHR